VEDINTASKHELDYLCAALSTTQIRSDDSIDSSYGFDQAGEAFR